MIISKIQIDKGDAISFIQGAIVEQIEKAIEEEFEKTKKRIDERKSEIIAGVLLRVQKMYSVERIGETIIFTIREDK